MFVSKVAPPKGPSKYQTLCKQLRDRETTMEKIAREEPSQFARHSKQFLNLVTELAPKRDLKPALAVVYGPPESGKSRAAFDLASEMFGQGEIFYYHPLADSSQEWWDGYYGQPCVIVDEMHGHMFPAISAS